jgi:hypothetical protein
MNLRHRWWMAGALLCMSAAAMQRARGEERPLEAPAPVARPSSAPVPVPVRAAVPAAAPAAAPVRDAGAPDPASAGAQRMGATVAGAGAEAEAGSVAPDDAEHMPPPGPADAGLLRLRREADAAYRARNFGEAQAAFERLVALDPDDAQAWLRLGNLHQQAGRDAQAMDAYRSASRVVADGEPETLARAKALLNIALLGIQAASRAIDEFDALRVTTLAPSRDAAARQVGAARRRASRAEGRLEARTRAEAGSDALRGEADSDRTPPAPAEFQPYTVDRWIATPRRPAAGRTAARASVLEPLTDTPLPTAPAIDVIRAVPGAQPAPGGAARR